MKKVLKNCELKPYNSFGVEAKALRIIEFDTPHELSEIFATELCDAESWSVLAGGNNILFTSDYNGTLLHPTCKGIELTSSDNDSATVRAEAAVEWDDFVAWTVERGMWGAENLSLIPGYVGAAPVQNIGAYGVEAKDIIESVEMYCVDSGAMLTLAADHCRFGYRESVFKHELRGKVIITAVNFRLSYCAEPKMGYGDLTAKVESLGGASLANIRRAVIEIRESKLPDPRVVGNAGSFFKNPTVSAEFAAALRERFAQMPSYPGSDGVGVKLAAGWLIDKAGWRGHIRERVGVHERQALVLINRSGATGSDVLELARDIQADVLAKFGVTIEMEVNVF